MAEAAKFDAITSMLATVEKKASRSGAAAKRHGATKGQSRSAGLSKAAAAVTKTWRALPGRKAALAAVQAAKKLKEDQKERGQESDYLAARREKKRLQDMKDRTVLRRLAEVEKDAMAKRSLCEGVQERIDSLIDGYEVSCECIDKRILGPTGLQGKQHKAAKAHVSNRIDKYMKRHENVNQAHLFDLEKLEDNM